jgi:hypothetical protein
MVPATAFISFIERHRSFFSYAAETSARNDVTSKEREHRQEDLNDETDTL